MGPPSHGSKVYFLEQNTESERLAIHLSEDKLLPFCINEDLVIMSVSQYEAARNEELLWQQRFESLSKSSSGNDYFDLKLNKLWHLPFRLTSFCDFILKQTFYLELHF